MAKIPIFPLDKITLFNVYFCLFATVLFAYLNMCQGFLPHKKGDKSLLCQHAVQK